MKTLALLGVLLLAATPAPGLGPSGLGGDDFQVNTYTTDKQLFPAVAVDPDGGFLVVRQSDASGGSDSDWWSVQGRRFTVSVFADGFESGDTSAWSTTVP